MKKLLFFVLGILLISSISAIDLNIDGKEDRITLISQVYDSTNFDLTIKNNGNSDSFRIYNLLGFEMNPRNTEEIKKGETKTISVQVKAPENFQQKGYYTFSYFIRASDDSEIERKLIINFVDLNNAFTIGANSFDPESNSVDIFIENKEDFDFKDLEVRFSSPFFSLSENFDLDSNEKKLFEIELNKEDYKKLQAGFYTLEAEIKLKDQLAEIEGKLEFQEKNILKEENNELGFFINTRTVSYSNEGNVESPVKVKETKNIVSRLFTTFSPEPSNTERNFLSIEYTWDETISPGETLNIQIKTNWFFPFILIIILVLIFLLIRKTYEQDLSIRKKVSFVKAKGGEFALKVNLSLHSKSYIEKVKLTERLPPLVKLFDRFGSETPTKVDEKRRKLEYSFERLEPGEVRTISYVIYSKIGVLGRFALPSAVAVYEKEGKLKRSSSNRAFFVAEQN